MKWIVISVALFISGCGLYDDLLVFDGRACESACGPCELGKWNCNTKSCSVSFDGVDEQAKCSGNDAQVVFVNAESDGGDGSKAKPFKTIQEALERPKARVVLVAGASTYAGPITLVDGVTIQGGWAKNWTPDQARPVIQTDEQTNGHTIGVIAQRLDRKTVLERLNVQTGPSSEGSNVGIWAFNAKDLILRDVSVTSSNSGSGVDGEDGLVGVAGKDGVRAGQGQVWRGGIAGANSTCPMADGGAGGDGELRQQGANQPATRGKSSVLGNKQAPLGVNGSTGENGATGNDGFKENEVFINSEGFFAYPNDATVGQNGSVGHGGGGGGGAAITSDGEGGGGGGGGAGGCGGQGGQPGSSGWPSTAILSVNSSLTLVRIVAVAGRGGDAGKGGQGGLGGQGGQGGQGSDGTLPNAQGGRGGAGGQGGQGGAGGHGQAGISVGLYCENTILKEVSDSDIRSDKGGLLPDGTEAEAQNTFQCEIPK